MGGNRQIGCHCNVLIGPKARAMIGVKADLAALFGEVCSDIDQGFAILFRQNRKRDPRKIKAVKPAKRIAQHGIVAALKHLFGCGIIAPVGKAAFAGFIGLDGIKAGQGTIDPADQ